MNDIVNLMKEKQTKIYAQLIDMDILKTNIQVLSGVISDLNENDISNVNIQFLEDKLRIVFPLKEAMTYYEIISMTVVLLRKCQKCSKIDEDFIKKYQEIFTKIKNDLVNELNKMSKQVTLINEEKLHKAYDELTKLMMVFENGGICSKDYLLKIYDFLLELGFSKIDIIYCLEQLNSNESHKKTETSSVLNVLKDEYKVIGIEEDLDYDRMAKIKSIRAYFKGEFSFSSFEEIVEKIKAFMKDNDELVIKNTLSFLLNDVKDQMDDLKECLIDKDFYFDDDALTEIVHNYYDLVKKYEFIKNMLKTDDKKETVSKRKVAYLMTQRESYLERDLKSIDSEYLGNIMDLLNSLINRDPLIVEMNFVKYDKSIHKIKYDKRSKIRIIGKVLDNGLLIILGCFIKNSQSADNEYDRICERDKCFSPHANKSNVSLGYDEVYERVVKYVDDNKRKGTRK